MHRAPALRRREALLRAAIEIIGEQGVGAVTHRAVAARAGVPAANTTYFFASIDELVEEAFRVWAARRSAELEEQVSLTLAENLSPGQIGDAFVELLFGEMDRAAELANYETYLQAARTLALRDVAAQALRSFERVAAKGLRAAGARRPEEGARAFTALTDGFIVQHLADPRPDTAVVFRQAVRALFIAYAMDDAERAAWNHRLDKAGPP